MKLSLVLPSTVALALAAAFTGGNTTEGFSTLGHSLSLNQRDFRVYNTFPGAGANNNITPDPNFPGAQGAVMAIWKGAIEWGSGLHGDGSGDISQSGDLGSGGGNFDPSFQGEANTIGGIGDNICSTISGSPGGVLAFVQVTGSGNWWMRFYDSWNWSDGPANIGGNQFDLQAVACHEYGHSLGLGHSAVSAATMAPAIGNGQIGTRSIHPDDSAGVQAIYGTASANKPEITNIASPMINQILITGSNFGSNNSVWFTRQDFQGNGTPIKVNGVPSTGGGTAITVTLPANIRSGDILVANLGLSGGGSLSNAWPFDIDSAQCPGSVTYCTSFPNSTGQVGLASVSGSQIIANNDTILTATNCPTGQFGIWVYGQGTGVLSVSNGLFCLNGSSFFRLGIVQTDPFGQANYNLDLTNLDPAGQISAGETWNFQFWHRENGGTANFTDATTFTWCQ